jgi:hypothetical protein
MRHSLRAHISYLETTIRSVRDRLAEPRLSPDEFQDLELQLTLAESALEHYRKAYELEVSVSGPEPPEGPEAQSQDGTGNGGNQTGEKKRGGLAIVARRRLKKNGPQDLPYPCTAPRKRKCA